MPNLKGTSRGGITDAMKVEARAIAAGLRRAVERTGRQVQEVIAAQRDACVWARMASNTSGHRWARH